MLYIWTTTGYSSHHAATTPRRPAYTHEIPDKTMRQDKKKWQHTANSSPNVQHTEVSVLYIVSNTSVTTNNRLETVYTVIFRVQHMNVLYAVPHPQRQNQHTGHLFHRSPTAHISTIQCTTDKVQDTHSIPPYIQIWSAWYYPTDMRCTKLAHRHSNNFPPSPTTAVPKRNNPPRIPHRTFYRHP